MTTIPATNGHYVAASKALAVVLISTGVAALLQYGLVLAAFGKPAPNLILVLAILASAAYAGLWAGLLATALCMLIAIETIPIASTSTAMSLQ